MVLGGVEFSEIGCADDCRAAMDLVLAKLPPGFIDRARFEPAWSARHRDGTGGTRKVDQELKALLPPDDQWPALSPVCDLAPAPPSDLFLRTLAHEAHRIARETGMPETAALLPYLVFTAVGDTRTCPEHEAVDGRVARITAKGVPAFVDWRWACRCTTDQVSRRIAERRGLQLPD